MPAQAWQPRTWHRYQYAYASPISYYDPYGMQVPLPVTPVPTPAPQPVSRPSPTPDLSHAPAPTGAGAPECVLNLSGFLSQLNRARRLLTGPLLGWGNVLHHLHVAYQYKIDPKLVMAIVYYESNAAERIL